MPLRSALYVLPLPVPTLRAAPATVEDGKTALLDERRKLHQLESYRAAIIVNQVSSLPGLPASMDEINLLIEEQRAVVAETEAQLVLVAAPLADPLAMP